MKQLRGFLGPCPSRHATNVPADGQCMEGYCDYPKTSESRWATSTPRRATLTASCSIKEWLAYPCAMRRYCTPSAGEKSKTNRSSGSTLSGRFVPVNTRSKAQRMLKVGYRCRSSGAGGCAVWRLLFRPERKRPPLSLIVHPTYVLSYEALNKQRICTTIQSKPEHPKTVCLACVSRPTPELSRYIMNDTGLVNTYHTAALS